MKKFALILTAIVTVCLCAFGFAACNNHPADTNTDFYLDEQTSSFYGGYKATVTDYTAENKITVNGNDYSTQYENGKYVTVSLTLVRESDGADEIVYTNGWFYLLVGESKVYASELGFTDFSIEDGRSKTLNLYFDVENVPEGNMSLCIAQPDQTEVGATVILGVRK